MKLIDILAQKMKVWPKNATHVVQDYIGPSAGIIYLLTGPKENTVKNESLGGWYLGEGVWSASDAFTNCELADDCRDAIVTREQWQAAVDALNKPTAPAWNGDGPPPVGAVCELSVSHKFTEGTRLEEFPAGTRLLVGGYANFGGHDVAVVVVSGRHFTGTILPGLLRPIRTAEQIAADEKRAGIESIVEAFRHTVGPCTHLLPYSTAERLYEIGVRLQVSQ